jgi:hypothetical protein
MAASKKKGRVRARRAASKPAPREERLSPKMLRSIEAGLMDCAAGNLAPLALGMDRDRLEDEFVQLHYAHNSLKEAMQHVRHIAASAHGVAGEMLNEWMAVYAVAGAALNFAAHRTSVRQHSKQRRSDGGNV